MDRKDWTDLMFSVQAWYDIAHRALIDQHRADAETKRKEKLGDGSDSSRQAEVAMPALPKHSETGGLQEV